MTANPPPPHPSKMKECPIKTENGRTPKTNPDGDGNLEENPLG